MVVDLGYRPPCVCGSLIRGELDRPPCVHQPPVGVVQPSVIRSGAGGDGARAVFLDPPYATSGDLYAETTAGIGEQVRAWCETAPGDLRIVLCGYEDEHDALLASGWTVTDGKSGGGAGYSTRADSGRRERLWLSPACLGMHQQDRLDLGDGAA